MTAKMLTGSIALALAMSAALGFAGPVASSVAPLAATVAGQAAPAVTPEMEAAGRQAMSDDLLRRARQAMAENDLQAAETLIGQTEALGVAYGPFHLGDTPKKVRRDLDRRRSQAAQPLVGLSGKGGSAADPFARQPSASPAAAAPTAPAQTAAHSGVSRLPPITQPSQPPVAPVAPAAAVPLPPVAAAAPSQANVALSNQLLLDARKALAFGDARRALMLVEQAKAAPVTRGPQDDAPEAVEAVVRRYSDLMAVSADRRNTDSFRREYARVLVEQADGLLRRGELDEAERLAQVAARQQATFGSLETRPETLLERLAAIRRQGGQMITPAAGQGGDAAASRAVYNPASDPTKNVPATSLQPAPAAPAAAAAPPAQPLAEPMSNVGMALLEQGEQAMRARDMEAAGRFFREAAAYRDQLDPIAAQRLQDHLHFLSVSQAGKAPATMAGEAAARQQVLARQVQADLIQEETASKAMMAKEPKAAIARMEQAKKKVVESGIDAAARDQLVRRADRVLGEMRQYVKENLPNIELDEKNQTVRDEINRTQKNKTERQQKLAEMVAEFNKLMEEQRYPEAEVVAKRAAELDPQNPVVVQLTYQAKFVRRFMNNASIASDKEQGFVDAMASVDRAAVPSDDQKPYAHGPVKEWEELTKTRAKQLASLEKHRSDRDLEIEKKLKTPVSLSFDNVPLSKVVDYLGKLAEVNVHLDPQGLADEGVTSDQAVTIKLEREVSLKSALNLILRPLRLNYMIKDEVLKITSEQMRDGEVYTVTYNVADLVVPIPNFIPSPDMGLGGALRNAMHNVGFGNGGGYSASAPMAVVASKDGGRGGSGAINPAVLAQMASGGAGAANGNVPIGAGGPGGLGGGSQVDFQPLMDLITGTIRPATWDTMGGPGSVKPFETNLSLVVSHTQEIHQEIVDLLEQLRRLQDLQVTIEVRFITLNDNFFERIGIDFDFDVNDNVDRPFQIFGRQNPQYQTVYDNNRGTDAAEPRDVLDRDLRRNESATVGMSAPGSFSADLDIPMRQGHFQVAVPQFGGFDAATNAGAQLGFAILSDIEAYFFIQAATRDRRTNVLQAPKVTLFNGQQAFVSDTSQSPFVISVIPVVGDFAAAQQPVIVVLSEGTFLTVQAVVSNDRRFVRLTVVPFFSRIGDVNTFTFTGRETTTDNTSSEGQQDQPNDNTKNSNEQTTTREGTTVQLPTFSFVTVTTTVSVPDGGTVLLGGIKRLSEGRDEAGVPILMKIPYVSRLFKNVGIGRQTQSLMMMVTPRIIIQEEEEDKLGVQP